MESADVEVFYEHQADPVAADMAAFPARGRAAHFDQRARRVLGDSSVIVRTITVDGAVAGNVVSWQDGRRRFLGYWIGRVFWGRGVATEAVRLYLREVDERPVYAYVADSNVGSRLVLEKNGFVMAADQPPPDPQDVEELLFVLN